MAQILYGKEVAESMRIAAQGLVTRLNSAGVTPCLALVRVGARPDDIAYEISISKKCEQWGIKVVSHILDEQCTQDELDACIISINEDPSVHGCLLFRPLPSYLDERRACGLLKPEKDIDGITPESLYGVFAHESKGYAPCTAEACIRMLDHYNIGIDGARVAVLGRSLVIGRPVSMLLQQRNATVTMCHSRTRTLSQICKESDIVIAAVGKARMVDESYVHEKLVVLDVGMSWDAKKNALVGDVDYDAVSTRTKAISPCLNGLGTVTTAVALDHVVDAAKKAVKR